MTDFILKIIPLILAFLVGLGAKKLKLLKKEDAPVLLKFVLTISIPAFAILAIYKVELHASMLVIPIFAMGIVMAMYLISRSLKPVLKMQNPMFGSFLVGTMIMNSAFALPFFSAAFGAEGLARASLFDLGNSFMIFTFSYYNAIKYGDNAQTDKIEWKKFLKMPPLWAMVIAFCIKVFGVHIPAVGLDFLGLIGAPTVPLVMVALGLYFELKLANLSKALLAIFIRMGLGLGIAWLGAMALGLSGLDKATVVVCAALPIGFNTLIFADLENMDREFAATMVSISLLISLIYVPFLLYLFF